MSTSILPTAFPGWEIGYEFYAGYLATPAGTDQEESAGRYAALIREELAREFPGAEIVVICKPGTTGLGGGPWALEPDGQPADWGDIGEAFQCAMDRAEARLWGKWTPEELAQGYRIVPLPDTPEGILREYKLRYGAY